MATETRIVRPFAVPAPVTDLVNSARLSIGEVILEPGGRATLDLDSYLHAPVHLSIGGHGGLSSQDLDEVLKGLNEIGVGPDEAHFAVNLYSSFLKISEYVVLCPVAEMVTLPAMVALATTGSRPDALRTPHSGCRVEAAILLTENREPCVGQPWRKGTWISRSRFNLSCQLEYSGFTPRPMDADQKAALGLPANATRYVSLPAGLDPLRDEATPEVLELWVDHDLLGAIAAQPKSALSVALQRQLFVDAFNAVTTIARGDHDIGDLHWADVEESMLGRLIQGLVGRERSVSGQEGAARGQQLFSLMRNDHARFMSIVEAHAGLTASLIKALQD